MRNVAPMEAVNADKRRYTVRTVEDTEVSVRRSFEEREMARM